MSIIPSPEELKRLRIAAGLTQKELAKLAGVSQSLIARIERGTVNPRISTLRKILNVINQTLRDVETVDKIMTSPVIYVSVNTPVTQVIDIMDSKGISQVPVVDVNNKVVGTIYESTLIKASKTGKNLKKLLAKDVMESPLPQVPKETPITVIEPLLLIYPAILITNRDSLKGIITKIDLIRHYVRSSK